MTAVCALPGGLALAPVTFCEKSAESDMMKYAKPRKPVVPQVGGGCFYADEDAQVRSICCLTKAKGNQSTGVLVRLAIHNKDQICILTCHHVLPSQDAEIPKCAFKHLLASTRTASSSGGIILRPDIFFVSDRSLDYSLVGIGWDEQMQEKSLPDPILLTLPRRQVFAGCAVRMIGYPRRLSLRCMYGVVTESSGNKFRSSCAHEPGMSGSSLFIDGEFVGIHTGYFESTDDASHTYVGAILSDVMKTLSNNNEETASDSQK